MINRFDADVIVRLAAALFSLVPVVAAFSSPMSVSSRAVDYQGMFAYANLIGLMLCSGAVIIDVFVNTIFACGRCYLTFLSKIRDNLYMALAFFLMVPIFTVANRQDQIVESAIYIYLVTFVVLVALYFCDSYAKSEVTESATTV